MPPNAAGNLSMKKVATYAKLDASFLPLYVKKYILGYRIITYLLLAVINFACIFWKVPSEAIGQFCYFVTYGL